MTVASAQAIDRYHGTLNAFRPPGKVIPENTDSLFQRLLKAWAEGFAGAEQFMWDSANDWIPANTVARLSDWEATLALPDNCGDAITSTEGRRAAVVSRLSMSAGRVDDRNGSSSAPAYLEKVAFESGYEIKIRVMYPLRFGRARFGQRFGINGTLIINVISIKGSAFSRNRFRTFRFGQRFATTDLQPLQCLMNRIAPGRYQLEYRLPVEYQ